MPKSRHASQLTLAAVVTAGAVLLSGCGSAEPEATSGRSSAPRNSAAPISQRRVEAAATPKLAADPSAFWGPEGAEPRTPSTMPDVDAAPLNGSPAAHRPPREFDEHRAAAAGIRRLEGKHLTLWTDLPASEEVDALPGVFDRAYPLWCRYFQIEPEQDPPWRMAGYLMQDEERFRATGMLPKQMRKFENGFAEGYELWLYEQPSDYYRRHLLLHEGTHGFMYTMLPGRGPAWYMEGMAELLGTHRLEGDRLHLPHFPQSREETPYLGRIKLVREAYARKDALALPRLISVGPDFNQQTEAYAWCWAVAALLDGHPRYQERFRTLYNRMDRLDFAEHFLELYADDWRDLVEEWQLFVGSLDYGYDVERMAVQFKPGEPLPPEGAQVTVAADRGWQGAGIRLEEGVQYEFVASGRYQLARQPAVWWSEPNGVSIDYHDGLPVGLLLAGLRADEPPKDGISRLLQPALVGLGTTITPSYSGSLYFRVNDSPASLADNSGTLQVTIRSVRGERLPPRAGPIAP